MGALPFEFLISLFIDLDRLSVGVLLGPVDVWVWRGSNTAHQFRHVPGPGLEPAHILELGLEQNIEVGLEEEDDELVAGKIKSSPG